MCQEDNYRKYCDMKNEWRDGCINGREPRGEEGGKDGKRETN